MAPINTLTYALFPRMHKSLAPSACCFFRHLGHYNSLGGVRETHSKLQGFCQKAQDAAVNPEENPCLSILLIAALQEGMPALFCTLIKVENRLFESLGYQAGNPHSLFFCALQWEGVMMSSYPDRFHHHSVWPGVTCSHLCACLLTRNNILSEK